MASPFGLAYGIGAGISGIPGAYIQGQEKAQAMQERQQAMGLRALQIEQMKKQAEEDEIARRVAMGEVEPKMETVKQAAPGFEESQKAYQMLGDIPGIERPNIPQVEVQQKYKFTTPWEQKYYEANKRADKMRSMGAWRTAMKLEDEADQYYKNHYNQALSNAGTLALGGQYGEASRYLKSIGMDMNVGASPNGQGFVRIEGADGNYADIPRSMVGEMIKNPSGFGMHESQIQWRNKELDRKLQRDKDLRDQFKIKQEFAEEKHADWLDATYARIAKMGAEQGTKFIKNYSFVRQLGEKQGLSGAALEDWIESHPAMRTANETPAAQTKVLLNIIDTELKSIQASNNNRIPNESSKYYARWSELQKQKAELGGSVRSRLTGDKKPTAGGAPPPPPGAKIL